MGSFKASAVPSAGAVSDGRARMESVPSPDAISDHLPPDATIWRALQPEAGAGGVHVIPSPDGAGGHS